MSSDSLPQRLAAEAVRTLRDAAATSLELFKVMVPVILVVKLLQELDLIGVVAGPLGPVMELVGLPAEMGLVWATALLNNIYGGIVVFLSLTEQAPVTAAQATVLATMLLVAHGLPVEVAIARKSGPRALFQVLSRVVGALILGWLLHTIYSATGALQGPALVLLEPDPQAATQGLAAWAWGQCLNLASIFGVILGLMAVMRVLDALGVLTLMNHVLKPVLRLVGIGPEASAITVAGLTLGLSYGGGLIIREARSGTVGRKDVFFSITLMGLCHSLIEDTLLMVMMGGRLSGVLWGRLAFAILAVALLVQAARRLPPKLGDKLLWGPPRTPAERNAPGAARNA